MSPADATGCQGSVCPPHLLGREGLAPQVSQVMSIQASRDIVDLGTR